jgi:hypothetical protein
MPKKTTPKPKPRSSKGSADHAPVAPELFARAVEAMIAWTTGKVKVVPRKMPIFATVDDDGRVETYDLNEGDPDVQVMRAIMRVSDDQRERMAILVRWNAMAELLRRRHGDGRGTESIEPMAALYAASQARLVAGTPTKPCHFDEAHFEEIYRKALPLFAE